MKSEVGLRTKVVSFMLIVILMLLSAFVGANLSQYNASHNIPELPQVDEYPEQGVGYPAPKQDSSEIFTKADVQYPFTFIVYGDSRETAGWEKDAVIEKIIQENPSFVIHTGDMVNCDGSHQWKIFDFFDGQIIKSGIPMYPALGNHEYNAGKKHPSLDPKKKLQLYFDRFDFLGERRWYSFKYGNAEFLMLDSNSDYSDGSHQYKWLIEKLSNDHKGFLFITLHHPVYSEFRMHPVRPSEKLLADLLGGRVTQGYNKADIVFSGHIHNYGRYTQDSINYVISGGGGAPQHSTVKNPDGTYGRKSNAFHYCKVMVSGEEAYFEMVRLNTKTGKWKVDDTFTIPKY